MSDGKIKKFCCSLKPDDFIKLAIYDCCIGPGKVLGVSDKGIRVEMVEDMCTMCYGDGPLLSNVLDVVYDEIAEIRMLEPGEYFLPASEITWDDINEKYPEVREEMSLEREREFVNDCFELYEKEGFADKFWSPYGDHKERFGASFEVVGRCTEENCHIDVLPMWNIRFDDGAVIGAYAEEIVPSEMKENGCPYFDSIEDKISSAVSKCQETPISRKSDPELDRV